MHSKQDMMYSCQIEMGVSAFAAPFENPFLDETKYNKPFIYIYNLIKLYIVQNGE
jgi:hypothetical protein